MRAQRKCCSYFCRDVPGRARRRARAKNVLLLLLLPPRSGRAQRSARANKCCSSFFCLECCSSFFCLDGPSSVPPFLLPLPPLLTITDPKLTSPAGTSRWRARSSRSSTTCAARWSRRAWSRSWEAAEPERLACSTPCAGALSTRPRSRASSGSTGRSTRWKTTRTSSGSCPRTTSCTRTSPCTSSALGETPSPTPTERTLTPLLRSQVRESPLLGPVPPAHGRPLRGHRGPRGPDPRGAPDVTRARQPRRRR